MKATTVAAVEEGCICGSGGYGGNYGSGNGGSQERKGRQIDQRKQW